MKIVPTMAIMPVLLALLTWLSLRAANPEAERFDRTLDEIDHLSMLEASLQRDVLSARVGTLRDYDPLVSETNAIDASLGRLQKMVFPDTATETDMTRLTAAVDREEDLVERFKTRNALLQNSLAYFATFSFNLSTVQTGAAWVPMLSALDGAMLRLNLDSSADVVNEARSRLDTLAEQTFASGQADQVKALLAHGHLLLRLLPATDGILREFASSSGKSSWRDLRTAVAAQQIDSRVTARSFRAALYFVSVLLVGLLAHAGMLLHARALTLRRRAAFEHVLAQISTRFINTPPHQLNLAVRSALAEMAAGLAADRSYALVHGSPASCYFWTRDGMAPAQDWPDQAASVFRLCPPVLDNIVYIPRVAKLRPGVVKTILEQAGVRGWACAFRKGTDGGDILLGFDVVTRDYELAEASELGLLRMAVDVIANALNRESLEQQREHLEARLQQAQRLETVGGLASGIAHNFNNIIAAILGYTEIADERNGDSHIIAEIRRAAERARELVEQILTFARRRDAPHAMVDIQALVDETVSLLRVSLPSTVGFRVSGNHSRVTVRGVQAQLQQVILNLCHNAANAIDYQGDIDLEISTSILADPRRLSHGSLAAGRYVRIAVSDAGSGIEQVALERIFEPFFTTRVDGSGLGLATAREIVSEHNGAINVQSEVGAGTRFEVWLPCLTAPGVAPPVAEATGPFGRGESVLLIEGDPSRLLRDEEIVAALGYEPIGMSRMEETADILRDLPDRFDAVVIGDPLERALELADTLHRRAEHLPILLATASTTEIGIDELLKVGIRDVIPWPITSGEISRALRNCLVQSNQRANQRVF